MFTKGFAQDATERAVRTFCQTLIAAFGAGVTVASIDWQAALAIAGTAALLSILMSIVGSKTGSADSGSLL